MNRLVQKLEGIEQCNYPLHSRVHGLRSLKAQNSSWYVKREDELGFGICGSKIRKYRTLIPFLRKYSEVVVIGSQLSNHVLGITQLLIENGIKPVLFVKKAASRELRGNLLFLHSIMPKDSLHIITKESVDEAAEEYAGTKEGVFVLKEGGDIFPSFLGALTLPIDIAHNQRELGWEFDHILVDSGTGLTASALILGSACLKLKAHIHVLLVAGNEIEFMRSFAARAEQFKGWFGGDISRQSYSLEVPALAKSFGAHNATLFDYMVRTMRAEGFFLDPIYSGKLFFHAQKLSEGDHLRGNVLLIHSGGALTLSGFDEQLIKAH